MNTVLQFKNQLQDDGFEVEYEVLIPENHNNIDVSIREIDELLIDNQEKLGSLNDKIDNLTNHADRTDYIAAVCSGILTGIIDSVFVGELSLDKANEWGDEEISKFVIKMAHQKGCPDNSDLVKSINFLETNFSIAADKAINDFGGGRQHHLRDFTHHMSLCGLISSLVTQFTGNVYGTDVGGNLISVSLNEAGSNLIGKNLHEKILFGFIYWFFHMVSDMAGSSSSVIDGKLGTGIPGPIVSLLKEVSSLPLFNKMNAKGYKEFSVWVSKLFNGTLLGRRDENGKLVPVKFDLRTEIGISHQIGHQAVPVIINECIVRGFYFIVRLVREIRDKNIQSISELTKIEPKKILPFKNRTIIRMLTISTGTFTAVDAADAAIRSAIKSGGMTPAFVPDMLLRINFAGVGRFAIAVGADLRMNTSREKLRNKRIIYMNQRAELYNARCFYRQADMWITLKSTADSIDDLYNTAANAQGDILEMFEDMEGSIKNISEDISSIDAHNPGLSDELLSVL